MTDNLNHIRRWIIEEEGVRRIFIVDPPEHRAYRCTARKITIGHGSNLDDEAVAKAVAKITNKTVADLKNLKAFLTDKEALALFEETFQVALKDAKRIVKSFDALDPARQAVVVAMSFQLGGSKKGFPSFIKTIALIDQGKFDAAASEMLNSKWARLDSPERARRTSKVMQTGDMSHAKKPKARPATGHRPHDVALSNRRPPEPVNTPPPDHHTDRTELARERDAARAGDSGANAGEGGEAIRGTSTINIRDL